MHAIDEWDEAGITKGVRRSVLRLIEHRFGTIPDELKTRIDQLPEPQAEELLLAVLDFKTLGDAEAWFASHPPSAESLT